MPNAQYASFSRIEETHTRVSDTQTPYYEKKHNKKIQTGVSHTLAAKREMKVTYIVYELTSGAQIWNGVVPITKTETNYHLHKFGSGAYTLRYPEFPTVQETFATASRGFAENLPERE